MKMTPLHLLILINAYTGIRPQIYPDSDASEDYASELESAGMIELSPYQGVTWEITEKGKAHIQALEALPFPVATWVTPGREKAQ